MDKFSPFSHFGASISVLGTPILWGDGYFTFGFDKRDPEFAMGEYLLAGPEKVDGYSVAGLQMTPVARAIGVDTSVDPNTGDRLQTPSAVVADYWRETEDSFMVKFALPVDQTSRFHEVARSLIMVFPRHNIEFPVTTTSLECPF